MHPLLPYLNAMYSRFPGIYRLEFHLARKLRSWLRTPIEKDHLIFKSFRRHRNLLVVDVGANLGQTIDAIRMCGWDCDIVSFEPIPHLYRRLQSTYRDSPRLTLHNQALGEARATQAFFIPRYRHLVFEGLASLDREKALHWLNHETLAGFDARQLDVQQIEVDVATLDDYGLDPFLIKLDVQGEELAVLKGARRTIERSRPIFLIETPNLQQEVAFLKQFNYELFAFDGRAFKRGKLGPLNSFMLPRERLEALASDYGLIFSET